MSLYILSIINICILNSFTCFLIYFFLKNIKRNKSEFFGICLDNEIKGKKKIVTINLKKGYYLHINRILPGYSFETNNLILKIKTKNTDRFISVYHGSSYDWNSLIDLNFGEEDDYVCFEYNTKIHLSGFYIPI